MKIVNRKEFMAYPPYTLFSEYEPCIFGDISIKHENCGDFDFFRSNTHDAIECDSGEDFTDKLDKSQKTGCSIDMDFESSGRDGCFQEDALYAIWENDDIEKLIETLKKCIKK